MLFYQNSNDHGLLMYNCSLKKEKIAALRAIKEHHQHVSLLLSPPSTVQSCHYLKTNRTIQYCGNRKKWPMLCVFEKAFLIGYRPRYLSYTSFSQHNHSCL